MIQPTLLAALGFFAQAQVGIPQPDAFIYGRISASAPAAVGAPIDSAVVELTGAGAAPRRLRGDGAGSYLVPALDAGVYALRFERDGYIPLTLEIRVPAHGSVHLDVTLDQAPPRMQTINILAHYPVSRVEDRRSAFTAYRPWDVDGDQLQVMPSLDFPDVTRAVAASPNAQISPESGGGLHLQGGATEHTLLLVDGIPLYNAIHAGERPSALDPDAVAGITVYGEPQARDGGRLSGVVDVRTRASLPDSEHFRSTIWPTGVRALTLLPFGGGSALIAARRNYGRQAQGDTREPGTVGLSDLFATASIPVAGGNLTGMVFSLSDAVAFDAVSDEFTSAMLPSGNRFGWTSDARALSWRRDSGRRAIEARVWQSGTTVGADWFTTPSQLFSLANRFMQTAASSSVSWLGRRTHTTVGASFEQLSARYSASGSIASGGSVSTSSLLALGSRPRIGSAFLEHSRPLGDRLLLTLGGRAVTVGGKGVLFEPRVAATYSARNGVTLSGAFARTHQYAQSLYNEESVVDVMASLEVPILAGAGGVPIASSTSISAELGVPTGSNGVLTLGWFARNFEGLVLTGPSTSAPFTTQGFATGSGSAYGARASLSQRFGQLSVEGAYSVSAILREWREQSYRPAFAPSHNVIVSAGYQLGHSTFFRASGLVSALRPTSPVVGAVAWEWQGALTSQRQVTGSPQYSAATFGAGRLPPYLRIDMGIRRNVNLSGPLRGKATLFANVDNLLGRRNALGIAQEVAGSGSRRLEMLPRSLSLGIALHF